MRRDAKMHTFPDRLLDERFRGTGAQMRVLSDLLIGRPCTRGERLAIIELASLEPLRDLPGFVDDVLGPEAEMAEAR